MRAERSASTPLWRLLRTFSLQELRHQGVRHAVAMLAVMLGVALAFSIQLINESALAEFSAAVRTVNGQADLVIKAARGELNESVYVQIAQHPDVRAVSPIIEVQTTVGGKALRVFGVDPLVARLTTPALVLQLPGEAWRADRTILFEPSLLYLNAPAQRLLGAQQGDALALQSGLKKIPLRVGGTVAAKGEPMAVMDIAGAQEAFGMVGKLSRLDVKLKEGRQVHMLLASLPLPEGVQAGTPADIATQASNMSRAYRVNLTVLALVALFTGSFLVFSTMSLSVAKRQQQFALLGVLGLSGRERLLLVLLESAAMGLVGAVLGIALGTGVAALTLAFVGGDLGGAYFGGTAPSMQWSGQMALLYGGLGLLAAVCGAVLPARAVQRIAPAQALKGATAPDRSGKAAWSGPALLLVGAALTQLPPIDGVPVWAYVAVACLMIGGIECVPAAVSGLVGAVIRVWPSHDLRRRAGLFLALERVRHMRQAATVAIAGIVVSLGLTIALTVMVSSFRGAITDWLDALLPADLYVRTGLSMGGGDTTHLNPAMLAAVSKVSGVQRVMGVRVTSFNLRQGLAPVVLIARPLSGANGDPAYRLPLIGEPLPSRPAQIGVYVSEIVVELYGARQGEVLNLPLRAGQPPVPTFVRGVWRDYAHQQGAIIIDQADYQRVSGDMAINDLALWLAPGVLPTDVQPGVRKAAKQQDLDDSLLIFEEPQDIRKSTLQVFDRAFAVTYWLQAVSMAIGLFGIAASFSGQILARRKEFGLLCHLGFTREQITALLAAEGAALAAVGALLGLALGLAVSLILVYVVNPQSFHWTMAMRMPWERLQLLCLGMVAAGTLAAWMAARSALGRDIVKAVKEDW